MTRISCLSLVLPCFNEQQAIPVVIPRALKQLDELKAGGQINDFEVIVVDDQSTDQSSKLLRTYGQLKVVTTQNQPRGYGSALKKGFLSARGDWIGFMDVDSSYRPEDLTQFVKVINESGSSFVMGQRSFSQKGMSWLRGIGNGFYGLLARFFYRSPIGDVCSGFRVFHRKHLNEVVDVPEPGLDFSIHLTVRMLINEVFIHPVAIQYDTRLGDSKLSVIKDGYYFLRVLLKGKMEFLRAVKHRRV